MLIGFIMIVSVLGLIACGRLVCIRMEKKDWNNGICPHCNTEWEFVSIDSYGERLYVCGCDLFHSVWIMTDVDKKKTNKEI